MDRDRLERRLGRAFDASPGELRAVVRQAGDLDDSGRYADLRGRPLRADDVVRNLREAPDGLGLVERWNWWTGALSLAHDGFDDFRVERFRED